MDKSPENEYNENNLEFKRENISQGDNPYFEINNKNKKPIELNEEIELNNNNNSFNDKNKY